jgi:hypothetical protein
VNVNQVASEQVEPSTSTLQIAGDETTGRRERRKWKIVDIGGLDDCLCGSRAVSTGEGVIQCKRVGCETGWVSKTCFLRIFDIKLTYTLFINPSSIILFAFALSRYLKIGFAMLVQL